MIAETVTFTKTVQIVDADGRAITEGSVLQHVTENDRGVVVQIRRKGDITGPLFSSVGDLCISTRPGVMRVTNNYTKWRHIPHIDQTYDERLTSWMNRPYEHSEYHEASRDEGKAIDGIMALLPDDVVDWDYGPFPDRLEDALRFLVDHLQSLSA